MLSLLHPNTIQGSFLPLQSCSEKTLKKKCPEKHSKIQTKRAYDPLAPYNTPYFRCVETKGQLFKRNNARVQENRVLNAKSRHFQFAQRLPFIKNHLS